MIKFYMLILCTFTLLLSGCSAVETISRDRLLAKTTQWRDPKVVTWYYKGSSDKYDYFMNIDLNTQSAYRVPFGDISLNKRFNLTEDKNYWVVIPWGPLIKD